MIDLEDKVQRMRDLGVTSATFAVSETGEMYAASIVLGPKPGPKPQSDSTESATKTQHDNANPPARDLSRAAASGLVPRAASSG